MPWEAGVPPRAIVYRSTKRRTFKACRTCRLQKARCIVSGEEPPCNRCQSTGRDCVFEELVGGSSSEGRKRPATDAEQGLKRPRYHELEKEVTQRRQLIGNFRATPLSRPPTSESERDPSIPLVNGEQIEHARSLSVIEGALSQDALTRLHLEAPITAVHAMTLAGLPPSPSSFQGHLDSPSSTLPSHSDASRPAGCVPRRVPKHDDLVSRGLLGELESRKLFQLYMANANVFLPLFDPTVDTFDTLRQRSTFCFTVILAIALRADSPAAGTSKRIEDCFAEAQRLAAKTLFASSAQLETVQGMILLAAHSERNWFAIRHACQMGKELGLPTILPRDWVSEAKDASPTNYSNRRYLRQVRTALVLHQVEQEVSSGTNRKSCGLPVKEAFLKSFLHNESLTAYDMRIVSNVEVVQLRARLLRDLETQSSLIGAVNERVQNLEQEIDSWFDRWDTVLQDQGFSVECFQRSSIRLQRDYAFIIVCSTVISRLCKEHTIQSTSDLMTEETTRIVQATLERSIKILNFITEDNDYKWHLQWAPSYSALFPAFTAALALRLAKLQPRTIDWRTLQSTFTTVADILGDYPHRHFSCLIRDLARVASGISETQPVRLESLSPKDGTTEPNTDRTSGHMLSLDQRDAFASSSISASANAEHSDSYNHLVDKAWTPATISQYPFHDALGTDLEMLPSQSTPDYAFDFNMFAASIEASVDVSDSGAL